MDLMASTITISSVFAIGMFVLGLLNYLANKKKNNSEDGEKIKENEARLVKIEALLVNIEKNTSNLYTKVENHDKLLTQHDGDIKVLKEKVKKVK